MIDAIRHRGESSGRAYGVVGTRSASQQGPLHDGWGFDRRLPKSSELFGCTRSQLRSERSRGGFAGLSHSYPTDPINQWDLDGNCMVAPNGRILPCTGQIVYVPQKQGSKYYVPNLDKRSGGYPDGVGNFWKWDPIRVEWDVQTNTRGGFVHTNVAESGNVTHGKVRVDGLSRMARFSGSVGLLGGFLDFYWFNQIFTEPDSSCAFAAAFNLPCLYTATVSEA